MAMEQRLPDNPEERQPLIVNREAVQENNGNVPPAPQLQARQENNFKKYVYFATGACIALVVAVLLALGVAAGSYLYANDKILNAIELSKSKFSTYELLGNDKCASIQGTSTIFTGYVLGFNGSSTFKCLPIKQYIQYYNTSFSMFADSPESVGYAKMTVYQSFRHSGQTNIHATCALCSIEGRNAILMMPATPECPQSWTREYYGYLMTDNTETTFVCVDIGLNGDIMENTIPDFSVLKHVTAYPERTRAHTYQSDYALSCAVCSK